MPMIENTPDTQKAIQKGVEAAFAWLVNAERHLDTQSSIQEGVEAAFRDWLEANTSTLIQAIAERMSEGQEAVA